MKEEQDDESSDRDTMGGPINDQPAGASEGAAIEPQAQQARCSVATCSLPVSASEILRVASALENNALTRDAIAGDGLALTDMQQKCRTEASALRYCSNVLKRHAEYIRRQVEHSNERQPEENVADEPRGKSAALLE